MEGIICIFGTGGFGREVLCCLKDSLAGTGRQLADAACFAVDDEYLEEERIMGIPVIPASAIDARKHRVIVAVGDPAARRRIVQSLPAGLQFASVIHPSAVLSEWVDIGAGSVVTAGCVLTCNIRIGAHAHINLHTSIGHDCVMGDYFTTAPGARVSGNCRLGNGVYLGSNASLKQGIYIADDTTIGMGAVVVKDIKESGTYIGNPARRLEARAAQTGA